MPLSLLTPDLQQPFLSPAIPLVKDERVFELICTNSTFRRFAMHNRQGREGGSVGRDYELFPSPPSPNRFVAEG